MQQIGQVLSGEFPLEGPGNLLVVFLKGAYSLPEINKGKEVVGRKHFSLEDGEINLDLVQPTGMDGKMNDNDLGPFALKPIDGGQSSVRGSVVKNPENPSGGTIGFTCHDVLDQTVKGDDPGFGFAPSEQFCSPYVPGSQVVQRPLSPVFEFHLLPLSNSRGQGRVPTMPCLKSFHRQR
jgi:hypothetical protein